MCGKFIYICEKCCNNSCDLNTTVDRENSYSNDQITASESRCLQPNQDMPKHSARISASRRAINAPVHMVTNVYQKKDAFKHCGNVGGIDLNNDKSIKVHYPVMSELPKVKQLTSLRLKPTPLHCLKNGG